MKILFQEPFVEKTITYGRFSAGAGNNTFPYGIASIASCVKEKGFGVLYLNPGLENMSHERYINFIKENNISLIGIGSTSLQISQTTSTFSFVKKHFPRITTVLGGIHGTLLPLETIRRNRSIDYLIIGEGEKPFLKLIECLNNGKKNAIRDIKGLCFMDGTAVVLNPPDHSDYLAQADIPVPLFDIFPMKRYVAQITFAKVFPSYSIVASRGCAFKCAFCNAGGVFGERVRLKPVSLLIDEIKILKQRYGAKGLMFLDSTFTFNRNWVKELCKGMLKTGIRLPWACGTRVDFIDRELLLLMKEAGCWEITYGVESANQKSLDLINKGTTVEKNTHAIQMALDLGFFVYTTYIICLPGESESDARNTIEYARKQGNHLALFYLPIPYPKTALSEICKYSGGLRDDAEWVDYNAWDFDNPVYINPLIGKKGMQELLKTAYIRFYSNPAVICRNLKEVILLKQDLYKYWLGLKGLANYVMR